MKNINIEKVKEVYNNTWRSYTEMQSNLPWFEDFRQEVETLKGYRGREILELLQNADDAGSPKACISLNTHSNTITITNFGEGTIPFSFEGFRAVMLSNLSPKESNGEERLIGAKGLGFKSVLNWAEKIELQSNYFRYRTSHVQVEGTEKETLYPTRNYQRPGRNGCPAGTLCSNLYFEVAGH